MTKVSLREDIKLMYYGQYSSINGSKLQDVSLVEIFIINWKEES